MTSARYHLASLWELFISRCKRLLPFYTKWDVERLIRDSEERMLRKNRNAWLQLFEEMDSHWAAMLGLKGRQKEYLENRVEILKKEFPVSPLSHLKND